MSRRLDVLAALKAKLSALFPGADVMGLDGDDAAPAKVGPLGRIIIRSGDLGDPEVDLSPLTYNWTHRIPLEVAAYETTAATSEEVVDGMLGLIGASVIADRQLGGLCDWMEPTAATTDDLFVDGAAVPKGANLMILASYSTADPLS